MKRYLIALIALSAWCAHAQVTPNLNLNLPVSGSSGWGDKINANSSMLDSYLSGVNPLPAITLSGAITAPTQAATKAYVDAHSFTLTTTGSSGPATLSANVLNIPQYSGASMVYPGAGVAVSTGSAWGTSLTLATVATTGAYADLSGKPTIPAAQVSSDWNSSTSPTQILNKPTLASVAVSGAYGDLSGKPTLGTAAAQPTSAFDAAGAASAAQTAATAAFTGDVTKSAGSFVTTVPKLTNAVITPAAGGPLTLDYAGKHVGLQKIGKMFVFGDSFTRGLGVNPYSLTMIGLLQRDVPATIYNLSIGSTETQQYGTQIVNGFDPDPNQTNVSVLSGEENNPNCGGVNACVQHYQQAQSFNLAWLTIPFTNRVMASNCTRTSGSWTYFGVAAVVLPTLTMQQSPGTNQEPFAGTPVLTCTVTTTTATTKIGISEVVATGQSGSFTATIDGSPITDGCTGTTTFNATPCSAFANGQTQGLYRQEYSVTPATSHTIVFTATGSPIIHSVDFAVPNAANNNVVFQFATNAAWANFAALNTALSGVISTFQADGLPVNFVDVVNGVTLNGTTYAVNGTTDVATTATATCSASNNAKHPNSCGHEHYREALQAAEYSALGPSGSTGFVFSSPNLDASTSGGDIAFYGPVVTKELGAAIPSATTIAPQFGVVHISGTTPVAIMTAPPVCLQLYNDCYVTLIFDSAGGSLVAGTQIGAFKFAYTAPAAGSAVTVVYGQNSLWTISNAGLPPTVFSITTGATPVINMALGSMQTITLSANAAPTLTNLVAGQKLSLEICQPASGGPWTWTPPAAMHGSTTITTTASQCTTQSFTSYNGTTLVADNSAAVVP